MRIKNLLPLFGMVGLAVLVGPSSRVSFGAPQEQAPLVEQQSPIASQADLDKFVAQLDEPDTRLSALSNLIRFCHFRLYQVGSVWVIEHNPNLSEEQNRTLDGLRDKAVEAIKNHASVELVNEALQSSDGDLQFWGIWFYCAGLWKEKQHQGALEAENRWLSLLPRIKVLAASGDGRVRIAAIEQLQGHSEFKEFLAERVEAETSPDVVLHLLQDPDKDVFSAKFNPYLLRFLNSPDKEVRLEALGLVAMNPNHAPMWQINFDQAIKDRVRELTQSKSDDEKRVALFALQGIQAPPRNDN